MKRIKNITRDSNGRFKKNCIALNKGIKTGVYKRCPICNKKFYVISSKIKKGYGTFCSRACAGKGKMKRIDGWTPLESKILKERWDKAEPHQWATILPNRTYFAIKAKARKLKLTRDLSKFSKIKIFQCIICKKKFKGYGNKKLCSYKCAAKHLAKIRLGKNNPAYNPNKYFKVNCLNCGIEFRYQKQGNHRRFCSKRCNSEYHSGTNAPNWRGGIQFFPYSNEFNKRLKERIKKRDGYACVLSGEKKSLIVHHIDYDKMNCKENNLITLSRKWHGATNTNRYFWQTFFKFAMGRYQIIKKGWGFEFIPITNRDYCLKALVFLKGKHSSDHYHKIKTESWYCLHGKVYIKLTQINGDIKELIFNGGDVIELPTGLSHQITAIEHSILLEVSTKDNFKDSYRIVGGD